MFRYCEVSRILFRRIHFPCGSRMDNFDKIKPFFICSIILYTLDDDITDDFLSGNLIYRSERETNSVDFLVVGDHICLIRKLSVLFKNIRCYICGF